MITTEILHDLQRLCYGAEPRMLMLGAQESLVPGFPRAKDWFRRYVGDEYDELDLADGDLKLDLNSDLPQLSQRYRTVFNLGTLEHCWDAHAAWVNAARAVAVGGRLLSHGPVGGWVDQQGRLDHGQHMTTIEAITRFLTGNGFEIVRTWTSKFRTRGLILWLHAEKIEHIEAERDFAKPYQVRGLSPTYRSTA